MAHPTETWQTSVTAVPPVDLGLGGAIVSYLFGPLFLRGALPDNAMSVLWHAPAILIAAAAIGAAYAAVRLPMVAALGKDKSTGTIDPELELAKEFMDLNAENEALAAESHWWHYLFSAVCGAAVGLTLVRALAAMFC